MQLLSILLSTAPTTGWVDDLLNPNSSLRSAIELLGTIVAIGGIPTTFFLICKKFWKWLVAPYREYKKFVDSVYSKDTRKAIAKYYIPTRAQDIDPCEFEEIRENNGNYITQLLVPFFCNDAFKSSSQGKYYLVLADSGMGKTTFLLRLYRECLYNRSIRKRLSTKLISLSQANCLQYIGKIENPENTILLLDALDENRDAIRDYESFFAELLKVTEGFNKVVITCRTQFFPNRATEPVETGRVRIGTGNKKEEIIKKYISPFSDEEVRLYLKKQYRFNRKKQKQAYEIIAKVPVLMARPVILNWINFLCDSTEEFKYSYQIYSTIIDKWIERESIGHTDRSLFDLSQAIAEHMYLNKTTSMSAKEVEDIASQKNIQLEPIIAKSRSLLNRNGNGEYKFAHRSFFEYFVVFGIFKTLQLPDNLVFLFGLSGARRFLFEILLDGASKSDPDMLKDCSDRFQIVRRYLNAETLLDFVNIRGIVFEANNTQNGFKVNACLKMKESEKYDQQNILFFNSKQFVDVSSKDKIIVRLDRVTDAKLSFTVVKIKASEPHVLIDFNALPPENIFKKAFKGHWQK